MACRRSSRAPVLGVTTVVCLAAFLVLGAATRADQTSTQAQETAAPQQPIFRTGVNLVRVDVTATGRNGAPVTDLRAGDFEVREDGVPQTIEQFQLVQLDGHPAPGDDYSLPIRSLEHGDAEASRPDVRLFAIFLDDYHVDYLPPAPNRVREIVTEFIKTTQQPTDLFVIMDPLTPLSALHYTRSQDELLERVRKFEGRKGEYMKARSPMEEAQLSSRDVVKLRAEVTLSALNALVTHLGILRERRTSVLFVSQGPPQSFRDHDIEDRVQELIENANRYNVTINTLDPLGLTVARLSNDILWRLSGETGGRAIVNTNDFRRGLGEIVRDASAYYLLAYTPTRSVNDGKFRKIEVSVKRKDVDVLARKGYWAPSPKEETLLPPPTKEAAPELRTALNVLASTGGGRTAVTWVGFEPGEGERTNVRFLWQPTAAATSPDSVPIVAVVTLRDAHDRVIGETRVPAVPSTTPGTRPTGQTTLDLPPGPAKVTMTFQGGDGGTVERLTDSWAIPDFRSRGVALGTPRLLLARSALEYRGLVQAPDAAIPTPVREFRRTDRVIVYARVAAEGSAGVVAEAQLMNRAGDKLAPVPAVLSGGDALRAEVPLASLAAGDYVLRVDVRRGDDTAAQMVAFRLVQ